MVAQEDNQPIPTAVDPADTNSTSAPNGDSNAAGLLKLARGEIDKGGEEGDLRSALHYLEQYREHALLTEPRRVFDTVPLARRIEESYDGPASVRADAHDFVQGTAALLEPWPELARKYEQQLLEAQLSAVEARRGNILFSLLPWLCLAVSAVGLIALMVARRNDVSSEVELYGVIAIPGGVVLAGIAFVFARARGARLAAEAENVRRKLNLRTLPAVPQSAESRDSAGGEYFATLVRINVDNLSDYYTQVRVHTNNSFWASIVAGGLGFALIAVGLGLGFSDSTANSISYIATGSGVIVEFISGVFFYLYNRTVRQLKDYHDSLLDVQNILLSFRIVEQSANDQHPPLLQKILDFLLQQRSRSGTPQLSPGKPD